MTDAPHGSATRTSGAVIATSAIGTLALGIGGLAAASAAPKGRVSFLCQGESPRPCTCYRLGTEPDGFFGNRMSEGAADGVLAATFTTLIAGLVCVVLVLLWARALRKTPTLPRPGWLLPTLAIGAAILLVVGFVLWIGRVGEAPCEDQGALGSILGFGSCRA